jgi:hypothetical protein
VPLYAPSTPSRPSPNPSTPRRHGRAKVHRSSSRPATAAAISDQLRRHCPLPRTRLRPVHRPPPPGLAAPPPARLAAASPLYVTGGEQHPNLVRVVWRSGFGGEEKRTSNHLDNIYGNASCLTSDGRRTHLPRRPTAHPFPTYMVKIIIYGGAHNHYNHTIYLISFLLPCRPSAEPGGAQRRCSTARSCVGRRHSSRRGARVLTLPVVSTPGVGEHAPLRHDEEADSGGSRLPGFHGGAPVSLRWARRAVEAAAERMGELLRPGRSSPLVGCHSPCGRQARQRQSSTTARCMLMLPAARGDGARLGARRSPRSSLAHGLLLQVAFSLPLPRRCYKCSARMLEK